jgi:hypothetical protein
MQSHMTQTSKLKKKNTVSRLIACLASMIHSLITELFWLTVITARHEIKTSITLLTRRDSYDNKPVGWLRNGQPALMPRMGRIFYSPSEQSCPACCLPTLPANRQRKRLSPSGMAAGAWNYRSISSESKVYNTQNFYFHALQTPPQCGSYAQANSVDYCICHPKEKQ